MISTAEKQKIFLDIGNSYIDYLCIGKKILVGKVKTQDFEKLYKKYSGGKFFVSCVVKEVEKKYSNYENVKFITYKDLSKLLAIKYYVKQPRFILGSDRILNIFAAKMLFKKDVIVISVGSCLVLDYLNKKSEYVGGEIFPGIRLVIESLDTKISQLRKVKFKFSKNLIGKNTEECIINAINNFYFSGIKNFIKVINPKNVIVTGGDSLLLKKFFENIKNRKIFFIKNLVLLGISYFCYLMKDLSLEEWLKVRKYFNLDIYGKNFSWNK